MPKPPVKRRVPAIISASRLTDIPRFYAPWFANRRKAGYCHSANSLGGRYIISLRREDVLGYLFWTRDARPLLKEIASIRAEGIPVAIQFTITGYGPELEINRVSLEEQIDSFRAAERVVPAPSCIQLRYDPVVVGGRYSPTWHEETLGQICEKLRGYTKVVNTSICEPYITAVSRIDRILAVQYRKLNPVRHPSTAKRFPRLGTLEPRPLLKRLSDVARGSEILLRLCANPEMLGENEIQSAQCCGYELFNAYPESQTLRLGSDRSIARWLPMSIVMRY
jgi:hypothetical protein